MKKRHVTIQEFQSLEKRLDRYEKRLDYINTRDRFIDNPSDNLQIVHSQDSIFYSVMVCTVELNPVCIMDISDEQAKLSELKVLGHKYIRSGNILKLIK